MAHSSPEGIELSKGSNLKSFNLSINKEKVLDEKWIPNKGSIIETDNNSVLNKQETLEEITEQIQKDCHKFVDSIISKVTYQDATNTFLFMKLAELTLKLKKYE